MKYLSELIGDEKRENFTDRPITGLSYDSRKVQDNYLFFAIKGFKNDGNEFMYDALAKGAVAIVSERETPPDMKEHIWLKVEDVRESMAMMSSRFHQEALELISLIGITGTNGKTTTSYIIQALLTAAGSNAGVMGTIGYKDMHDTAVSFLTTPESIDIHMFLEKLVQQKVRYAVMEVSSHSISLKRVYGMHFAIALFTNLTRDHLDYHKTIEAYFEAKKQLFERDSKINSDIALVNGDDLYGRKIYHERKSGGMKVFSYGLRPDNDLRCTRYEIERTGTVMVMEMGAKKFTIRSRLIGFPNVYNMLAACSTAFLLEISPEMISKGVQQFEGVPGRLERVDYGQDFSAIIDYAHTEDAIDYLLETVKKLTDKRVIIVFGCGGDRDQGKRSLMGKAAAQKADYIILTSDNPRSEDPVSIMNRVEEGILSVGNHPAFEKIIDREEAIGKAIQVARPGDVVVLAGKGHENYQIIGTEKKHFCERDILKDAIRSLKK